jgi:ATP-dependent RNA helicase MSS116
MEIHSRKSQAARTKTSDLFRVAKSGILFSSDVSARGWDWGHGCLVVLLTMLLVLLGMGVAVV